VAGKKFRGGDSIAMVVIEPAPTVGLLFVAGGVTTIGDVAGTRFISVGDLAKGRRLIGTYPRLGPVFENLNVLASKKIYDPFLQGKQTTRLEPPSRGLVNEQTRGG